MAELLSYGASLCEVRDSVVVWGRVGAQWLVQALGVLHGLGMIHGDVKPSNALWNARDRHVVLIDFGNAQRGPEWPHGADTLLANADLTVVVAADIGGTDGFRAPESYDCALYATDVFSAGCTLAWQVRVHQVLSCIDAPQLAGYAKPLAMAVHDARSFNDWSRRCGAKFVQRSPVRRGLAVGAAHPQWVIHERAFAKQLFAVMRNMLANDPNDRPSATTCQQALLQLLKAG
jgi:serine/threonine protein kinase